MTWEMRPSSVDNNLLPWKVVRETLLTFFNGTPNQSVAELPVYLTSAGDQGKQLSWQKSLVFDKYCFAKICPLMRGHAAKYGTIFAT